jgi:ribulose-5-phosphate 4-epimerase/fuculose-1-phosphate aldolase
MAVRYPVQAAVKLKPIESHRPPHIEPEEWALRVDLAAAYRIVDHLGWSLIIFNHITARVPGPEHHFLINPYGLRYDEVTASNLVKIDLKGNKLDDSPWGVNPAGFVIHSAIHGHVPEALCVMHTHTKEGMAVASKRAGLKNTNFYSAMIWDYVAYHDFEGLTTREEEQQRMLKSLGTRPLAILRNHGLLAHGRSVQECFARMLTLQWACEIQCQTDSMPGENLVVSDEATRWSTQDSRLFGNEPVCGHDSFGALQRVIEAKDPSYKT